MMRSVFIAALISFGLSACADQQLDPSPQSDAKVVPWSEALRILNEGNVDTVFQTHDSWVGFTMLDGTYFDSKAPGLDLIIKEIEKCAKCENVGIILE